MFQFLTDGSRRRALIAGLVLVVVVLAGGGLWHARASAATAAAAASSADDANGVNTLLGLADSAMHDGRLVAPEGSNAYEFYFSVLQLEPSNPVALANLHKAFVPASEEVERLINQVNLDEAQRELSLLREYDADNYTLLLLSGKLGAQRMLVTKQHEAQAALIQAQASAAAHGNQIF
ncbi:MAG: energy transducer TonB [Rhodanobacter sp.]